MIDVVLVTEKKYLIRDQEDWYLEQIFEDDDHLIHGLEKNGLSSKRVSWDDPKFDWNSAKVCVIRSPWDYADRQEEFFLWLEHVSKASILLNPESQIRWNLDKHYLGELAEAGVNIPSSRYIKKGETRPLADVVLESGWDKCVLKPTIAGGARHTYLLNTRNVGEHESVFKELIGAEDMMLQEFMHNIQSRGEVSMMMINGEFTHAIIKKAKAGDFRVQDDWGGTVEPYEPSESELEFAKDVVSKCETTPFYGRVDMLWDNDGKPALGELEIIEPEMWFRYCPESAHKLADVIKREFFS